MLGGDAVRAQCVWWGGAGGAGGRAGAAMEHYSSSLSFGGASLFVKKEDVWAGAVGAVGAVWGVWVAGRERCGSAGWAVSVGGGWSCWGSFFSSER